MADTNLVPGAGSLTLSFPIEGVSNFDGGIPGYPPVAPWLSDEKQHRRDIARTLNNALRGNINVTQYVTLTASATSTTFQDARIGVTTFFGLMPMSANAATAASNVWFSPPTKGIVVINHASSANLDQKFKILIIG